MKGAGDQPVFLPVRLLGEVGWSGRGGGALTINQVQVFKFPSDSQVLSFSSKPAEIAVVIDVSIASIAAGSFFC